MCSCPHFGTQPLPAASKRAIRTTKVTPIEVVTDDALAYLTVLDDLLEATWTAPSGTPTTELRPITAA